MVVMWGKEEAEEEEEEAAVEGIILHIDMIDQVYLHILVDSGQDECAVYDKVVVVVHMQTMPTCGVI